MIMHPSTSLFVLLAFTGCARYEFDVLEPPDLARHIGPDKWETANWGPVDYNLRTVENRLVIDVHNVTDREMRLLGDRSYVVGPDGQSHPLGGRIIGPKSFVRLILPPMMRVVYPSGPRVGFGIGFGGGGWHHHHGGGYFVGGGAYDPFWDQPQYAVVFDGPEGGYWEWPGEGEARLTLVIQQAGAGGEAGAQLTHQFTVRRKRL
ncbi:MAG: hypothetical protein ACAI43_11620 [Phycisphaerae bacterium]|nr:hypothetical protein [Tepidisphaeraceae bacterium]